MLHALGLLLTATLVQDAPAPRDSIPRSRTTVLPLVSYSGVTGLQYGGALFHVFRVGAVAQARPSTVSAVLAGTGKGHARAHVQLERWSPGNGTRSRARVEHISYPLPYYGIGSDAGEDAEEWYSSGVTTLQLFTERSVRGPVLIHAGLRYVRSRLLDADPGGVLETGLPSGSIRSDVRSVTLGAVLDSRDNIGAPRGGSWVRLLPSMALTAAGSEYSFRRLNVDARHYRAIGRGFVVALQMQYDGLAGEAPFDQLPMIGADTAMRGYARGRYRDQHALTSQLEVRSPHWRRVGGVAFVGAGTVAASLSGFGSATWFPTIGAGARYVLSPRERTTVRVDFGIGRGSTGFSVGIGEAF